MSKRAFILSRLHAVASSISYSDVTPTPEGSQEDDSSQQQQSDSCSVDPASSVSPGDGSISITIAPAAVLGISCTAMLQAATFLFDGLKQRSINHKVDPFSLRLYNSFFHTRYRSVPLLLALTVLLILPFIEYPSSLSISADLRNTSLSARPQPPCGVTESFELLALIVLAIDCVLRYYLSGYRRFLGKPWLVAYSVLLILSFLDIMISPMFCGIDGQANIAATLRLRRYFRPIFLIIRTRTMKKFFKAIIKTVLAISTMLIMLLIILFLFSMFGLLVFHHVINLQQSGNTTVAPSSNEIDYFATFSDTLINLLVFLTTSNSPDIMTAPYTQNRFAFFYFSSFLTLALFVILSLITAMIYAEFRGYLKHSMQHSLLRRRIGYRAAFAVLQQEMKHERVGTELVMQLLHHGRFLPCLLGKMRGRLNELCDNEGRVGWDSFLEVLNLMETHDPYELINSIEIEKREKQKQKKNSIVSLSVEEPSQSKISRKRNWLNVVILKYSRLPAKVKTVLSIPIDNPLAVVQTISSIAIVINAIVLGAILDVDFDAIAIHAKYSIQNWTLVFSIWYSFELCFKLVYIIVQRARHKKLFPKRNRFCIISLKLIDMAMLFAIVALSLVVYSFDVAFHYWHTRYVQYFSMIQVICILILLRLFHVISFFPVASTLLRTSIDIFRILLPLFGLMVFVFYEFALLGMSLFGSNYKLDNDTTSRVMQCNTYENLQYYAYNFHDFAATIVVLWNLMVVNNWHVFLQAYRYATGTTLSWLYFVAWWFVSVIIILNVFLTLVIEVCVNHWENFHKELRRRHTGRYYLWKVLLPTGELEPCSSVIHGTKIYDILREELEDPSHEKLLIAVNRHEIINKPILQY